MLSALCAVVIAQPARDEVVFRVKYAAPNAKRVLLAGDYTGWGSPAPMVQVGPDWVFSASVPAHSRLEYKVIVDGIWITDPANPVAVDNGVGGTNSVFTGPEYKASFLEHEPKAPMLRRELTVEGRKVVVFAPRKSKGLPILAYGDGDNYESRGKVHNVLQNLVESGRAKPAVIVLVQPKDRMNEYGPGWKEYGGFLLDKVLPAVRAATGASDSARKVFLGGSSMGGVISLRLAEEFPDKVAGGVHSQSGAFQWGPLALNHESLVTEASLRKLHPRLRLWLCWGEYEHELTQSNVSAVKTLKKMGRKFGSSVTAEGHTWTSWRARMVDGLTYLLGRG